MKNLIIITCIFLGISTGTLQAQENEVFETNKDIIRLYPQYFITTTFYAGYERILSSRHSLELDAGITSGTLQQEKHEGYMAELKWRIFFNSLMDFMSSNRQRGYMSTFINYQALTTSDSRPEPLEDKADYHIYAGGVTFGVQIFALANLNIDLYIGGGVQYSTSTNANQIYEPVLNFLEPAYNGPYPKAGFSVGLGL
ncbi:MAG: DUF3575 domain-containing protein [Bacteroidia bacterium]